MWYCGENSDGYTVSQLRSQCGPITMSRINILCVPGNYPGCSTKFFGGVTDNKTGQSYKCGVNYLDTHGGLLTVPGFVMVHVKGIAGRRRTIKLTPPGCLITANGYVLESVSSYRE